MLVFWRNFHLVLREIGYEEEAVFDRADCFNFKAGGDGDCCGRSDPTDRDIGADLLPFEELVWRAAV